MTSPVVVRFAPSPTGYLHIGGARTALFNWLYAKANNGKFLLRIEDTDRERLPQKPLKPSSMDCDGWDWIGMATRSRNMSAPTATARSPNNSWPKVRPIAVTSPKANWPKCARRRNKGKSRSRSNPPGATATCVRGTSRCPGCYPPSRPKDGETIVSDHVQGEVQFANKELDDVIILRSDGSPTYNLAVVVDDHDMGITHVIRGVDHLTNAARQTQIYQLLGWQVPQWAHVPLIHGPDGAKLSKRHGAFGCRSLP
jgi:glutamyl-tRNA synthetase